ncbi:VOC family protein [Kribbella sancticallisti]|uniref:VOC family protein n=1 Tax=Kribbella sancticallisti TaxID=460087 RepID=UPI0031DF4A46
MGPVEGAELVAQGGGRRSLMEGAGLTEGAGLMDGAGLLRKVDAVMVKVPDLDSGLAFYRDKLGHELLWRNDEIGQAGLRLPEGETEIVLATDVGYGPSWLVDDADEAAAAVVEAGGEVRAGPFDIPVGQCAVVADAFGNELVLVDLSKGLYSTDDNGSVTAVEKRGSGNP